MGVAGIGKTATYHGLCSLYTEKQNWLPFEYVNTFLKSKKLRRKEKAKLYIKKLLKLKALLKYRCVYDRNLMDRFVAQNPVFIEAFWKTIDKDLENFHGKDVRFHAVDYLWRIIERIQIIENYNSDRLCVLDEGLIHQINYFLNKEPGFSYSEQACEILKGIHQNKLPSAVIFFDGDAETVLKRTQSRGDNIYRDAHLSEEEIVRTRIDSLEKNRIIIAAITKNKIPVLHLNANEDLNNKALKIKSFINDLNNK